MTTLTLDAVQQTAQSNPKDEIIFGGMNEDELHTMLEEIKKEGFDGPFTVEESKVFLDKVVLGK